MTALDALLNARRVAVCVGSGGVGKTTVAASLAFRAALEGQKALVVTIDPARRLANSLGLEHLGNVEARIGPERFSRAGLEPKGELWAMMLDVKRTSDDVIARHATSREQAEKIYKNRFYQTASTVLAGSQEYMAMEKLYEIHEEDRFDLVVLDTPPTAHALDFLDAPNRLLDVFGNESLRWIATPAVAAGKVGMRAVGLGGGYLVRQISKFTGVETLQALAEFLMSMQGMYEGFKDRAAKVKALLASQDTTFVLVTAPGTMTLDEARYFYTLLQQNDMPVGAVVVNRVHPDWTGAAGGDVGAEGLAADYGPDLAGRLAETLAEQHVLAEADRGEIATLAGELEDSTLLRLVPVFDRDVHDLAGLATMARCLFDGDGAPASQALPAIAVGDGR
jgi:anion-transporting  ArsA/GET3 family ATPase